MKEIITTIADYVFVSIQSFFAEYTILLLLVGLAFLSVGIFIISYEIFTRIRGQKIEGTIVGAVRKVKVKIVDGKVIRKRLNHGTLFPVFEYVGADGVTHQAKGSAGGSHVYKYKTGQRVALIVLARNGYDDVSDAQSYSGYVIGLIFAAIGVGVIYSYAILYASFNFSTFIWLSIISSLVFKYKDKVEDMIKDYRENKKHKDTVISMRKNFDPEDLQPIEWYVEQREKSHRQSS